MIMREKKEIKKLTSVFLGIPSYDGRIHNGLVSAIFGAAAEGVLGKIQIQSFSWLTRNFNDLYAAALNAKREGITHFCMLHDDVVPERAGWLDKMLAIMLKHDASMLAVVIPLKDEKGLTSTAIDIPKGGTRFRRLTLKEVYKKDPTFTQPDILLNTGLMLIDLQKPWAEKLSFGFEDGIGLDKDGKFKAFGTPEDWLISRRAKMMGAKIYATREVEVTHIGGGKWSNASPWGTLESDT